MANPRVPDRIGPFLLQLKTDSGLTYDRIAAKMPRGRATTVRDMCQKGANPKWETIAAFLNALGLTVQDLASHAQPTVKAQPVPKSIREGLETMRALAAQLHEDAQ